MNLSFRILIICASCAFLWPNVFSAQTSSPDLTKLEESVREQITTEQNALAASLKDPAISKTALSEAYGRLGQIYHAYSLTAAARDCYVNANLLNPGDFRWIYLLARLDQQEGRFDEAIRRYTAARTLRPDYVPALVNLGNIFLELNRLEDAGASFLSALKIDEQNAAAHYGLGQVAMSRRNYIEAVSHFEKTLLEVPAANRVHYSLAMAYRGLGDAAKVKAHLAQQGTVGVRVSDPLVDGLQDLITGERIYLSRGKLAFEARRFAEAAAEFRKAIAVKPDSFTARVNLGATLTQLGDRKGAAEQFEEAIRIEPRKPNAHYNLAVLLSGDNKHEQAINHLQLVVEIDPGDVDARFLLAQELMRARRFDEALDLAQRLYKATGAVEHGALVAMALAELGRCTEAAEWQRRMIVAAEQQGNTTLLTKLRTDLKLYEQAQCRRTGFHDSPDLLLDDVFLQPRHEREDLALLFLRNFELVERGGEVFCGGVPVRFCDPESRVGRLHIPTRINTWSTSRRTKLVENMLANALL
jgi:tetratricopeptide (TPR) repeat protein